MNGGYGLEYFIEEIACWLIKKIWEIRVWLYKHKRVNKKFLKELKEFYRQVNPPVDSK
ncbi:MAG: hypothetical protein QXJ28_00700 [Candidatus Pacearchaeota archaeon]